jgi:hypothetical protein
MGGGYDRFKDNNLRPIYERFANSFSGILGRNKKKEANTGLSSKEKYADQASGE